MIFFGIDELSQEVFFLFLLIFFIHLLICLQRQLVSEVLHGFIEIQYKDIFDSQKAALFPQFLKNQHRLHQREASFRFLNIFETESHKDSRQLQGFHGAPILSSVNLFFVLS